MIAFVVYVVGIYLAIGLVLAFPFVFSWLKRINPMMQNATLPFRVLCIPGTAILWPYLLIRIYHK